MGHERVHDLEYTGEITEQQVFAESDVDYTAMVRGFRSILRSAKFFRVLILTPL